MEATQLLQPILPFLLRGQKIVPHIAEELDFHNVDLLNSKRRDLGPRLIRIRIIIQNYIKS